MDEHSDFGKLSNALLNAKSVGVLGERAGSHVVEGFSRPEVIPVHGAAVNDGGELSATLSELFSNRGEGQHNVETLSALGDKVIELGVSAVTLSCFTSASLDILTDGGLLISRE